MVTPFDADGALDIGAAVELARHLQSTGTEAIVVAGTTGEAPVLSNEEKVGLWEAVASAATVPVIAGSTTNDTAHDVELTKEAEKAGAAAILAVTPYYNRPSQTGISRHFSAIVDAYVASGGPVRHPCADWPQDSERHDGEARPGAQKRHRGQRRGR